MENHEIAQCYPPLSDEEFQKLKAHIAANGLLNPLVLYEGKILDGTQRARACAELGIEPRYITAEIENPFNYVIGQNERRRQLSKRQLTAVAEEMANLKHGSNRYAIKVEGCMQPSTFTRDDIAAKFGLGRATLGYLRFARTHGIEELLLAVKSDKLAVRAAYEIAHLPKDEQPKALETAIAKGPRQKKSAAKEPQVDKLARPVASARLAPDRIAELEARMRAESIYPEGLPLPVHPDAGLTAHLHEAFVELKAVEPLIPQMSRRQLYDDVWVYTQRIQTFAPGFGKEAYIIKDIDSRWVEWAGNVARKVRAREALIIERQRSQPEPRSDGQPKKRRQFADLFERRIKQWRIWMRRALDEVCFPLVEEARLIQETEKILLHHFEDIRSRRDRLTPSKIGAPNHSAATAAINGSPSLNGEH
jgi:ParB-like chromosome segregation protein Spo0J